MAHELIAHAVALMIAVRDRKLASRQLRGVVQRVHGQIDAADAAATVVVTVPAGQYDAATAAIGRLGVVRQRRDESVDMRQALERDDAAVRDIARAQSAMRSLSPHPLDVHAKPLAHALQHRRTLLDEIATGRITVRFVRP